MYTSIHEIHGSNQYSTSNTGRRIYQYGVIFATFWSSVHVYKHEYTWVYRQKCNYSVYNYTRICIYIYIDIYMSMIIGGAVTPISGLHSPSCRGCIPIHGRYCRSQSHETNPNGIPMISLSKSCTPTWRAEMVERCKVWNKMCLEFIWLVVLTILKNISQFEGLSHILWKI